MAASQQNGEQQQTTNPEADLAQAFKELAQGERTATNMENQLTALEQKIDHLLAQAEQAQKENAGTPAAGDTRDESKAA